MGKIEIIGVAGRRLIKMTALLAREIWKEHFTPIIGKGQVDYMLAKFQSEEAISQQIESEGFLYYLLKADDEYIGYTGIVPDKNKAELFLSKLYIKQDKRRRGYAKKAVLFIEHFARQKGLAKITLTVNKNNASAIEAYQKMGFENADSIVMDIGGGFLMDDYRMEKRIGSIKKCSG